MEDEEWERYWKSLNVKCHPFINCEYYVPFRIKYAHLPPRRPTRPATGILFNFSSITLLLLFNFIVIMMIVFFIFIKIIERPRRRRIHGQLPAAAGNYCSQNYYYCFLMCCFICICF